MHFELLVEDVSGKAALDIIVPKIIDPTLHTFNVHSYKGIGRIPKNLAGTVDASKRILLDQLPRLLRGYGRTFASYPEEYKAVVILVCDLDDKCLKSFKEELEQLLHACNPQPITRFCIAIEEGEAWFLGDLNAIKSAYPRAKDQVLNGYKNDSICGTWETMANAIFPQGAAGLAAQGWQAVGAEKSNWARNIAPFMDIQNNSSPSFKYFVKSLTDFIEIEPAKV